MAGGRRARRSRSRPIPSGHTRTPTHTAGRLTAGRMRPVANDRSHLDALFGEVLGGARVPRDRRVLRRLVGEIDAFGLAMDRDQLIALLDEGLDDIVGDLVVHALVGDQDVLHHRDLVVLVLTWIGLGCNYAGAVDAAVLGVHLVDSVVMV